MSILTSYPFDSAGNYLFDDSKIEVIDGKAQLKLVDWAGLPFVEDFEDDTGFTYDSDKVEFFGGKVRQRHQVANATFGANYNSDVDGNWGGDDLTGTPVGGAAVSGGRLDLAHDDTRHVDYNAVGNAKFTQTGTIKFKVTPNYTGTPIDEMTFFCISKNLSIPGPGYENENVLLLRHRNDGSLAAPIRGSDGNTIYDFFSFGLWVPISGVEYEFELNVDLNTPAMRLFVDGTQVGLTGTEEGIRDNNIFGLRIGCSGSGGNTSNFKIDDIIIFSTVQHTADYTPGYTVPDAHYLASTVILPEMEYTGPGTMIAAQAFTTIESGLPRYTVQVDRSGDDLYWDGSAWVVSDGTYAQATDAETANANAPAVPCVGAIYGQFKLYFPDSDTISDVDNTILLLTGQAYPVDNPTIKPASAINADSFDSYSETVIKAGSDDIKNVVEIDGQNKYWNGSAWVNSAGYAQSNSESDSMDNASALDITLGVELRTVWHIHSENGMTTPALDLATLGYDFFGPPDTKPETCEVYGYVTDKAAQDKENITVEVKPIRAQVVKDANFLMDGQSSTITTNSVGYFEKELIRSSAFNPEMGYRFTFRNAQGRLLFDRTVKIPDQLSCSFDGLEDI